MDKIKSRWVFLGFWGLTMLLYYRTMNAGFTMDFVGWQESYDNGDFKDILNCFGYPGLHQILHLVFYSFYWIFGTDGLPWYLLFTFLHAVNGALAFQFFRFFLTQLKIQNGGEMAFAAALLFLVNPYHVEPIVWKVCVHYLLSLGFLLTILWNASQYMVYGRKNRLIYTHLALVLALFTLELSLVFPLLVLVYTLFGSYTFARSTSVKKNLLGLVVPQFSLLAIYLWLNKLILGDWIGHYGSEVHLKVNFTEMLGTLYKYFAKIGLLGRFWEFKKAESLFGFFGRPVVVWGMTALLVLATIIIIARWSKVSNTIKVSWLFLASFFIGLLPVANLFFYFLLYGENDRYGYLATPFLMALLVIGFFQFRKIPKYILIFSWLGISIFYQQKVSTAWQENAVIHESLMNNFSWHDRPKVLVLNSPDNYRGTFLYRIFGENVPIVGDLKYHLRKPYLGELKSVVQYNMMHLDEGVQVEQVDSVNLKVIFNQWGNWWWRDGIGANNYETDLYQFKHIHKGYQLTFKKKPVDYTLIYQVGPKWHEFELK